VSVNPIPLCAGFPLEFASVIVSVLVPPTLIEGALYDLVTVGEGITGAQNVRGPSTSGITSGSSSFVRFNRLPNELVTKS